MSKKKWTGERLETTVFNQNTTEHLHRYALASSLAAGKAVLDIASGEGYGSKLLSHVAEKVTGVDIDPESIDLATKKYAAANLIFLQGSASAIPVKDSSIEFVVSFETLEHHAAHEEMFQEIKRVLYPGGLLMMSSPDKKYYSDIPGNHNPHHVKELYSDEFKSLVKRHFSNALFFTQSMIAGSLIIPESGISGFEMYEGNYESVNKVADFPGVYNICLASDHLLPQLTASMFDGRHIQTMLINEAVQGIRNSWRYRIGDMLLRPLKLFRK